MKDQKFPSIFDIQSHMIYSWRWEKLSDKIRKNTKKWLYQNLPSNLYYE